MFKQARYILIIISLYFLWSCQPASKIAKSASKQPYQVQNEVDSLPMVIIENPKPIDTFQEDSLPTKNNKVGKVDTTSAIGVGENMPGTYVANNGFRLAINPYYPNGVANAFCNTEKIYEYPYKMSIKNRYASKVFANEYSNILSCSSTESSIIFKIQSLSHISYPESELTIDANRKIVYLDQDF